MELSRDAISVIVEEGIARITLDAPQRLNAVDPPMLAAFHFVLDTLDRDPLVRVIAVAGAGRGFCAGADIGSGDVGRAGPGPGPQSGTDEDEQEHPDGPDMSGTGSPLDGTLFGLGKVIRRMAQARTPIVALVDGVAAGAGVSVALACDYILASEAASFVLAFAKIGLMPDGGATALVAANIGRARAMRLALTGERLDAATAERWGLVSELVSVEQFEARAQKLLYFLAAGAPAAMAATRQAINAATLDIEATLTREEQDQSALLRTDDFAEGVTAFRERRPARFADARPLASPFPSATT